MASTPSRILVRAPNWAGDVVMATPALIALRHRFPDAELVALMKRYVAPLLAGWELLDGLITIDPDDGGGVRRTWRVGRRIRERGFDLAVLLTNSFGSAAEAFLGRVPTRVGYRADARSALLTTAVAPVMEGRRRRPIPMVDFYLGVTDAVGCARPPRSYSLRTSSEQEAWVDAWLGRHGLDPARPMIGVNPGAKFGSSKLWRPDRFADAADRIGRERDAQIVLLGGPGEEALLAEISAALPAPHVNSGRDIVPLGELKALVRRLDLLLTTDTGTRAIAQAFGVPCVVVMGSTHPGWTDANNERSRVLRHDVSCGPCHQKVCHLDHRCMELITVDEVVAAARALSGS